MSDCDPSSVVVEVGDPQIEIRKDYAPIVDEVPAGIRDGDPQPFGSQPSSEPLQWIVVVTNTGDVELTDVVISDPQAPNCNLVLPVLAVGDFEYYTCSSASPPNGTPVTNVVQVQATGGGQTVNDSDPSTVLFERE